MRPTKVARPDAGAASPEPADDSASQIVHRTTNGVVITIDEPIPSRSMSQLRTTDVVSTGASIADAACTDVNVGFAGEEVESPVQL